jgi:hypothetical protein
LHLTYKKRKEKESTVEISSYVFTSGTSLNSSSPLKSRTQKSLKNYTSSRERYKGVKPLEVGFIFIFVKYDQVITGSIIMFTNRAIISDRQPPVGTYRFTCKETRRRKYTNCNSSY